ncbi:MAG: plastocyanin/azurin family copper-binding protein [Solirubrobacterales bacterium]
MAVPAIANGAPNRVSATGDEASETDMSLVLSRSKIDPGRAVIQFINSGEDVHDLQVKRKGAPDVQGHTGNVQPGEQEEVELTLRKGSKYALWCSIADHRDLGMDATLTVRKR